MSPPPTLSLVLRRARAFPAPVAAVAVNVLVVCTLVSGLAASLTLLQQDALAQTMAAEPQERTVVEASAPYDAEQPERQDQAVRDALAPVTSVAGGDVVGVVETSTYDVAGAAGEDRDGWVVASVAGDDGRLGTADGSLPSATSTGPLEVAAPQGSDLVPGQRITLVARTDGRRVPAVVTGTWVVPRDERRWLSDLEANALVTAPDRIGEVAGTATRARWRAVPSLPTLGPDQLRPLAAAVPRASTELEAAGNELSTTISMETELPAALAERARELTVLRALLLVPAGLLVLVAAAGLLLVAAGLADVRREEEGLLRSRGANQRQLVGPTVLETLLLCGLAALVAPPVATAVIRIGEVRPPLGAAAWLGSSVAAAICAVALAVPVAVRALTGDRGRQDGVERQRRRSLTGLVATGILVAGLGLLAVATLSRFGQDVGGSSATTGGVDPLLVSSPALLLLAVAVVVSLVALPPVFRVVSTLLSSRGVASSLGSRFAARALRVSVPLALTVALASGVLAFAAVERDSSAAARAARADHVSGADLRVMAPPSAARAGVAEERRVLRGIPGVQVVTPVHRADSFVQDLPAQVLMTDVSERTAPDLLGAGVRGWRNVIAPPWADDTVGTPLPDGTERLGVGVNGGGTAPTELWLAGSEGEVTVVRARLRGGRVSVRLPDTLASGTRLVAVRTDIGSVVDAQSASATPPSVAVTADGERVATDAHWFAPDRIVYVTFGTQPLEVPPTVPVALTEELASSASLEVGDTIEIPLLGIPSQVEVVATIPYLRTVVGGSGGVLVDADTALPTLLTRGLVDEPDEWWLAAEPGRTAAIAEELAEHPDVAMSVVTRAEVLDQLDADPSTGGAALGRVLLLTGGGCLVVGALLLFSVVLLRRPEHSEQARRIGAAGGDRRDLVGVLSWEYAVTTGAGLVAGVLAGGIVAAVTLVSMTLGPDGELLVPAPELEIPWVAVLAAPLVMVTVPLLAMVWLTRRSHSRGLGALDAGGGR